MAENDLLHYHKVLKQFLDISDDSSSRAKSNSSRAQRAREKLLKLSLAQFRELSTDVYDELRRRIDELRSEPDFLLPKLTFHPKRNQARQKLSSLPQSRFKDLVSDISFEIERRNLHLPEALQSSPNGAHGLANTSTGSHTRSQSTDMNGSTQPHSQPVNRSASGAQSSHGVSELYQPPADLGADTDSTKDAFHPRATEPDQAEHANRNHAGLRDELATPDLTQVPQKSIGVQSSAVVPTKATLAWLSDESEDENGHETSGHADAENEPRRLSFSNISPRKATEEISRPEERGINESSNMATGALAGAGVGAGVGAAVSRSLSSDTNAQELATLRAENERLAQENAAVKEQQQAIEKQNLELQARYASLEQNHATVLTEKSQLQGQVEDHIKTRENMPDPEILSELQSELEKLKAAAAALRLENQSLKTSVPKEPRTTSRDFSNTNFHKDGDTSPKALRTTLTRDGPVDINTELGNLYQKMDVLASSKTVAPSREDALLNEVSLWKARFESAQAGRLAKALNSFELPVLQNFLSPHGSVPLETGTSFFALIESFLISINDQNVDTDLIFDQISNIAILANKITDSGGKSVFASNDYTGSVREAATHALTSTRYHISYPVLLPKIVVERAISELAFSVCDYLSLAKLSLGDASKTTTHIVNVPTQSEAETDGAYVRPLKMTSKLSSITNLETMKDHTKQGQNPNISVASDDGNTSTRDFKGALSESLPVANHVQETSDVKAASKKLSLFERILNSKVAASAKDGKSIGTDLANKEVELSENVKENIAPQAGNVASVPQVSPNSNKLPISPAKSSIMDKVKQFESPPSGTVSPKPSSTAKDSPSVSVKSTRALFSNGSHKNDTSSPIASKEIKKADPNLSMTSDADTSNVSLTRGRSIFQSLRERFTNDTAKEADTTTEAEDKVNQSEAEVAPVEAKSATVGEPISLESPVNERATLSNAQTTSPERRPSEVETSYSSPARTQSYKKIVSGSPLLKRVDYDNDEVFTEPVAQEVSPAKSSKSIQPDSPLAKKTGQSDFKVKVLNGVPTNTNTNTPPFKGIPTKSPSFKVKKVNYANVPPEKESDEELDDEEREEDEARQRQEYRKSMAAATFNFDRFDIDDPDNTLTQVLLYLEHQTVQVISTIQDLLSAIKKPDATRGELRTNSKAISEVISQMTEATNTSMNQTRNHQLKEHGSWVVKSLEDCNHRMFTLCRPTAEKEDLDFADKNFKQRLAGISFDIAKCTKELVKTVEEASLKEDIAQLDARLSHPDDLT